MVKIYKIIDLENNTAYEEGITLEQAKQIAIRIMERAIEEDDPKYGNENVTYLKRLKSSKTAQAIDEWLSWFGYALEEL